MTKFNPDLIQKARKGEIAILNDGSVEELREVLIEAWPEDDWLIGGANKYYYARYADDVCHTGTKETKLPYYSVKAFFMPDTKEPEIVWNSESFIKDDQPRTYRVTRQQMKEIYDLADEYSTDEQISGLTRNIFDPFLNEANLNIKEVKAILSNFPNDPYPDLLKSIFPSYFYIPEGEPVLVRDFDTDKWKVYVSDGGGGVYVNNFLHAEGSCEYKQIIPFTKNPPK